MLGQQTYNKRVAKNIRQGVNVDPAGKASMKAR